MTNTREDIPGWFKSPEAAKFLGLTESQFRRVHWEISSIQLHRNGPRLFKIDDVKKFKEEVT